MDCTYTGIFLAPLWQVKAHCTGLFIDGFTHTFIQQRGLVPCRALPNLLGAMDFSGISTSNPLVIGQPALSMERKPPTVDWQKPLQWQRGSRGRCWKAPNPLLNPGECRKDCSTPHTKGPPQAPSDRLPAGWPWMFSTVALRHPTTAHGGGTHTHTLRPLNPVPQTNPLSGPDTKSSPENYPLQEDLITSQWGCMCPPDGWIFLPQSQASPFDRTCARIIANLGILSTRKRPHSNSLDGWLLPLS